MGRPVLGCSLGSWRLLNDRLNLACTYDMADDKGGEIYSRQEPVVSLQVGIDYQQIKHLGLNVKPSNW